MFGENEKIPIFLETASHFRKQRHIYIDCIPLPAMIARQAPLYFKVIFTDFSRRENFVPLFLISHDYKFFFHRKPLVNLNRNGHRILNLLIQMRKD